MRNRAFGLILCLAATSLVVPEGSRAQSWESMIAQLRESKAIHCSLVGFAHTPSEQYALYQAVVACGDRTRFQALLEDVHPVVRCVGLLGLAQKDGPKSVATLREYLSDRDVMYFWS